MAVHDSLELQNGACDEDGHQLRTGTLLTCIAHIITAVIGSGVLSLAWSTAQLGWVAGPVSLAFFAVVTFVSAFLLSDCYRSPDSVTGSRNYTYMDAVRVNLGRKHTWVCGLLQYLSLYGTCVAYTITTSISMRAIQRSNCYHREGHQAASNGSIKGNIGGVPASTPVQKLWKVSQAVGDIAFAYPYSIILLEIQDTLKSPPPENQTMKKASITAIFITTFFYLCCGCFGYAAFGNTTPGNLLTGFGFYEPYWLIDFANACIVLHLIGGYQVYSQPVFAFVENWLSGRFPGSGFVNNVYTIQIPFLPPYKVHLLRICFRTAYVVSTTGLAMLFPYFNDVLGVLGALNFWPLAIYFPVQMYFVQKKIGAWTRKWVILQSFSLFCLIVSTVALVGSIEGLVSEKLS
ncbi:Amino acid transporter [Cinnamomum micranthum f. kanehirae]|uniref:Amino acid transporter n=1 Tax=Cinnamomum micranthum f. kanehirae TaxID=337451 RepID=A0A3S3QEK6_9MAGN|nr:Amino acid transporter [Cinnamomum micranthum f. kanehirae]